MIENDVLSRYLSQLLNSSEYEDYAPNGLQVEGKKKINNICSAVTASADVIQQAAEKNADALLVHHGFFWKGEASVITGMKYQRIASLIKHNINLYAYHLPLDCHPEYGNNRCIADLLEIKQYQTHKAGSVPGLLWSGELSTPADGESLGKALKNKLNQEPLHISVNNEPIKHIAWCTGAAQDFIEIASRIGVDAYLSGEISERTYYQAKELGIHYFACGHHATERYGIQVLGRHLEHHFGVEHQFIDSDNPA